MKNKKWTKKQIIVSLREMEQKAKDKNQITAYFLKQTADFFEYDLETDEQKYVVETWDMVSEAIELIEKKLLPYRVASVSYQKPIIKKTIAFLREAVVTPPSDYPKPWLREDNDENEKMKVIETLESMLINNDLNEISNVFLEEMKETIKYAICDCDFKGEPRIINEANNKLLKEAISLFEEALGMESLTHEDENIINNYKLEKILVLLNDVYKLSDDFLWKLNIANRT